MHQENRGGADSLILRPLAVIAPVLIVALEIFAGPYRMIAYKFRAPGNDLVACASILLFPAIANNLKPLSEGGGPVLFWALLAAAAWLQVSVRWCSRLPPRDPGSTHPWAGPAEPAVALAVVCLAKFCMGDGGGILILLGYVCSAIKVWLVRLRWAYESGAFNSTEMPSHGVVSRFIGSVREAAGAASISVVGFARAACKHAAAAFLSTGKSALAIARYLFLALSPRAASGPPPVVSHGGEPGTPTINIVMPHKEGLGERLRKGLVIWLIITCLTSAFSMRHIIGRGMEIVGGLFTGRTFREGLDWGREKVEEAGDRLDDLKEEAGERVGQLKEKASDRLRLARERGVGGMRRVYEDKKEAVTDEMGRMGKDVVRRSIFGR